MPTFRFKSADFEQVFGWLEDNRVAPVEVWGLEDGRAAALLAYSEGPADAFGWSNWASADRQDPSELSPLFPDLELYIEDAPAQRITSAFPGVFTPAPT